MPEIRIPLYGMVGLSDLEWDIVNSPPFQRLRRIRQLAFTDLVYPGATHTRFEHSIGVMHLATQAFERIRQKRKAREMLENANGLHYNSVSWDCARQTIRLAALIHDLGHLPFSHAAEEVVLPARTNGERYTHEDYSHGFATFYLSDLLANHRDNAGLSLSAADIVGFLRGETTTNRLAALAPWRGLIVGELDCDRMDYLRRDSHHMGIQYGLFDVDRILSTLTFVEHPEEGDVRLGVEEGGLLAIESLILARYYMFMQVYFHKVRRFLDIQYAESFNQYLGAGKTLPPPDCKESLDKLLTIDDWRLHHELRQLADAGFEPAQRVISRDCMKVAFEILDPAGYPNLADAQDLLKSADIGSIVDSKAVSATQRFSKSALFVEGETSFRGVRPIGGVSKVATSVPDRIFVQRIYVARENRDKARELLKELTQGEASADE